MQMRKLPIYLLTLIIALTGLVACQPLEAPAPTESANVESGLVAEKSLYQDPDGLFTAPIPTNWTAQQADGYGILSSPNDGIQVYVLAVDADDLEAAVQDAWQMVDPAFDLEPDQILEEPAGRVERAITVTYDLEDEERFALGGGWLHDGIAYITLVEGRSGQRAAARLADADHPLRLRYLGRRRGEPGRRRTSADHAGGA